jgi:hypothetical protein
LNPAHVGWGSELGHSAMSAQCPVCPKAEVDPRSCDVAKVAQATPARLLHRLGEPAGASAIAPKETYGTARVRVLIPA